MAQERILMAQDDAASMLVRAMGDKRIPFSERRKVAEFLLTYENRNEVKVMIEPWEAAISGILVDDPEDGIIDAEIVEEVRALPSAEDDEPELSIMYDPPPHRLSGPRLR